MEGLLVVIGAIIIAIPATLIYLLVVVSRLKAEVRRISAKLETQEAPEPRPVVSNRPAQDPPSETVREKPEIVQEAPVVSEQPKPTAPWGTASAVPATAPTPPKGPGLSDRLAKWLSQNWFYAVSALSLSLAGVFLVQYGIETGLLTPSMRVAAALIFGAALIAAGEWIRRRYGDGEDSTTAYLPSVLSGAGLVSLFGAVLAARLLYDLTGPGPAFAGLVAITVLGLVLGWMQGPLLAAVALLGGFAAPFLVGGGSDSLEWLMGYFAVLAALGLGIDTLRRWAWVSALSVLLGFAAGWFLWAGAGGESLGAGLSALAVALVLMATLIPARGLTPDHADPCLSENLVTKNSTQWPIFPIVLSLATLAATCATLLATAPETETLFWIATLCLAGLAGLFILWARPAPGLQDAAALPAVCLLAIMLVPEVHAPLRDGLTDRAARLEGQTETRMALEITWLFAQAVGLSTLAAWRSLRGPAHPVPWAGAAALFAPLAGLALEVSLTPALRIGEWPWALHALTLAALMTLLAERFARADGAPGLRTALAVISALAALAFAFGVLLTSAALTLALGATVVAAAALDRRLNLPQLGLYVVAGVLGIGYRLGLDPGLDWAMRAPILEMLAAYGGTTLLLLAALALLPERPRARVFLESAAWAAGGMTLSLLLYHLIATFAETSQGTHWSLGLQGTIWAVLALAQLERLKLQGPLQALRIALATVFGLTGLGFLAAAAGPANPLLDLLDILGPVGLNTLMPAYLLPATLIGIGAWRLTHLPMALRLGLGALGAAGATLWAGLAIRHGWRGSAGMIFETGTSQPELYSYTVAILALGAVIFYQALARRSDLLRRVGTAVIALAVAKVFLVDASGLSGLARVLSFLLLGLALAALAWLNRWAESRARPD